MKALIPSVYYKDRKSIKEITFNIGEIVHKLHYNHYHITSLGSELNYKIISTST